MLYVRPVPSRMALRALGLWNLSLVPWVFLPRVSFFFQEEDGIRDLIVTGIQTCALPISTKRSMAAPASTPPTWRASATPARTYPRSEERRVGKECRSRWSAYH